MIFHNLESVVSAYVDMTIAETNTMFAQGDVIVQAVAQGYSAQALVNACASQAKRSERTVWRRYHTALTFAPERRNPEMCWEIHALCSETKAPHEWLAIAVDEQFSTRELEAAIKAAGETVAKPEFVLKSQVCAVYENADGTYTVVPGEGAYKVTIVQELKAPSVHENDSISQIGEG